MKVIAEIGSNVSSLSDCLNSIIKAKSCGVDIIKFQFIEPGDLRPDCTINILPREWVPIIAKECLSVNIEFMCSAFSPEGYSFINTYVKKHKIASAECTDDNILKIVNSFGKPVLLSTGGASLGQIDHAIGLLKDCDVTIFYCDPNYPSKGIDAEVFLSLKERYVRIGYSDHTLDNIQAPAIAKGFGCEYLEKHVTFRPDLDTPDRNHSLNEIQLRSMCFRLNRPLYSYDVNFNFKHQRKQYGEKFYRPY
jgi:sialic acid synthase SpsE